MPGKRSPDVIQVNLRLPKELRKRLVAAAAGGSLNAEMVERLETTFRREAADKILDRAQRLLAEAQRMSDEATSIIAEREAEIEKDLRAGVPMDDVFPRNRLLARMKK